MVRELNSFYAGALALAEEISKREGVPCDLPPPLCLGCLKAFRSSVTDLVHEDRRHDNALWAQLRAGRMSVDEFLSLVRDRHTYEAGAESIRKRRSAGTGEGVV